MRFGRPFVKRFVLCCRTVVLSCPILSVTLVYCGHATWYGDRPRPRRHCVRWGPMQLLKRKGALRPTAFRPTLLWHGRPSQRVTVVSRTICINNFEYSTYIRQGGHHVGHWPTFLVLSFFLLFFSRLISAVRDWMFTILWHMVWP